MKSSEQNTDTLLMIEPVEFSYNPQTAINNYFQQDQHEDNPEDDAAQKLALAEFKAMVAKLRNEGIDIIVEKDTPYPHTPDSIFPNNWISFHSDGQVIIYPMFAENRRLERRMDVFLSVEKYMGKLYRLTDISKYELEERFLEGTGSIVLDRENNIAYASISQRTDKSLFLQYCSHMNFHPFYFHATQMYENARLPVYHTNVMMCVADKFAVVCFESIENRDERHNLEKELKKSGKQIVDISLEQMNRFAGNMLQVKNKSGQKFMILSQAAYDSLNKIQIDIIAAENKLIVIPIPTIEKRGGGSVRCMVAEIF